MKYFLANYTISDKIGHRREGYKLIHAEYLHQAEDIISNWLVDNIRTEPPPQGTMAASKENARWIYDGRNW